MKTGYWLGAGLLMAVSLVSSVARAEISFTNGRWSTTFDYGPCTQRGGGGMPDCATVGGLYAADGIQWSYGASDIDGHYTQTAAEANNPMGGGGNGFRAWVASTSHEASGPVGVLFPGYEKELWIRWYQRYQAGLSWTDLSYDKTLYLSTDGPGYSVIPEFYQDKYVVITQGVVPPSTYYQVVGSHGWNDVMGGGASDGQFHCYEIHVRMDTNGSDGIGQLWIDGDLQASNSSVNYSDNKAEVQKGWTGYSFENNQEYLASAQAMYIDYDDMIIYNTTPPAVDADGNPFIGPIGGGSGGSGGNGGSAGSGGSAGASGGNAGSDAGGGAGHAGDGSGGDAGGKDAGAVDGGGTGGGAPAGGSAGGSGKAGAAAGAEPMEEESGCGCRTAGGAPRSMAALMLLALAALASRGRRRLPTRLRE